MLHESAAQLLSTGDPTLFEQARRELERRFITLELPPGSVWSEVALSEMVEIGRTPVREAVARMAVDGLVHVVRRAGVRVRDISVEDQLAVLDTRRVLERLVSVRAARRAKETERHTLRDMAERIARAGLHKDALSVVRSLFEIKRFVAESARNPYAERSLRPLFTLSQRFYFAHHRALDNLETVGRAHAELTLAIADGDEELAATRSDRVSDIAEKFTRELLIRS